MQKLTDPPAEENVLEIVNGGPIAGSFKIELDGPGLYCLQGGKGTGKSTIMRALQLLQGHSVDITVHDGELAGHVAGFGVVAPIASRKRARGEFALNTLGDRDSRTFADIVSPAGKTPETRDKECIRALATLSGAKADPAPYEQLVGGKLQFDQLGIGPLTDDPVALAGQVKAALEAKARELEVVSQQEEGHAAAQLEQAIGLDLTLESDTEALLENLNASRTKWSRLRDLKAAGAAQREQIAHTLRKLESAEQAYRGPTYRDAEQALAQAGEALEAAREVVSGLELDLKSANRTASERLSAYTAASEAKKIARLHQETISSWKSTISTPVEDVTDEELESARREGDGARAAYDRAIRVTEARRAAARGAEHRKISEEFQERSAYYRELAQKTFGALTASLKTDRIFVEEIDGEARLFVRHPTRGKTFFDRVNGLSEGERIMVAIDELLPRIGEPGLFDIPQEVYQGIQPADRKQLDIYAREHGIYLFGAEVTDGDLRVVKGA